MNIPRTQKRIMLYVLLPALLLGGILVWSLRPIPASPLKLTLDWFAENDPGGPFAVIRITNQSSVGFRWRAETLVLSNGMWKRAARQPEFSAPTAHVNGHGWSGINVPVSDEGKKWKVELSCRRKDTVIEDAIEDACRFLHLPDPFKESRKRLIKTELEFER
jgi:hypothetical protein